MILRQLFDRETYTFTYLLADDNTREACIIDPVTGKCEQYLQLIKELNLKLIMALDTHVHADHVTALGELRDATACITLVGYEGEVACATRGLVDQEILNLGSLNLKVLFTPGHTNDSYSFYIEHGGQSIVFTGDTLFIRGTGRTDFQNGDAAQLYESLHSILLKLPSETLVYPGHDYKGFSVSTIAEEQEHNPRLQIKEKEEFIIHMGELNLPDPKFMDIAVPANKGCGKVSSNV